MTRLKNRELSEIIKGCLQNKLAMQNELYRRFYSRAMSVSVRYFTNMDDTKNSVNEAFMNVFKYLRNYDRNLPFDPWFTRIVINAALNNVKKSQQSQAVEQLNHDNVFQDESENVIDKLSYRELLKCIQKLTVKYRTVFNLYVIDGFKHQEIARILNISEGTSKSNLLRAKQNLREIINNRLYGK